MAFQPGATLYTQGFGSRPENVEVPHIETRNPATTDVLYPIGKRWLNVDTDHEFILYSFQSVGGITQAVWASPSGLTGSVESLSDGTTKVYADSLGNIALVGTSEQVTVTSNAGLNKLQFSLPSTVSITNLNANGNVSLANLSAGTVLIGNPGPGTVLQTVTIESGNILNIGVTNENTTINVGNANDNGMFVSAPTTYLSGLTVQGGLLSTFSLQVTDATFAINSSSVLIGPTTFNATGVESAINCNTTGGAITINLAAPNGDGQFLIITDSNGNANTNNITVNAPGGGNIFDFGSPAAATIRIDANYGNLLFYTIPSTSNYMVINANHT